MNFNFDCNDRVVITVHPNFILDGFSRIVAAHKEVGVIVGVDYDDNTFNVKFPSGSHRYYFKDAWGFSLLASQRLIHEKQKQTTKDR